MFTLLIYVQKFFHPLFGSLFNLQTFLSSYMKYIVTFVLRFISISPNHYFKNIFLLSCFSQFCRCIYQIQRKQILTPCLYYFFSRQKQTLRSKYEIVFPHFLTQSTEAKTLHEKNNLVFKLLLTTALYCLILHHKFIKNVRIILHAI